MRDNTSRYRWYALLLLLLTAPLLAGCDESTPAGVAPTAVKEVAPSGPLERLAVPEGVLVFGGSDNLAGLVGKLAQMVPAAGAAVGEQTIAKGLAARYGLSDATVLALDKPARVAVIDPKKHGDATVLLISVRSKEALLASISTKKDGDAGNAHSFAAAGRTTYLNFLDDYAVLTSDAELFGQHKSFLLRLAGAQVTHATLVVSGKNAGAAFKTELDAAIAEVKKSADAPDSPLNGPGLGKMLEWMISVARDLDTIVMRIEPTEDGAKLAIDVSAVAQSALDKSMRLLGERKLALLDDIPVDAPAAFVMSIDPDNDDELTRSLTAWSLQLSLGQQVDEKYADAMNAYWKATTGDMAFAAHSAPRGHAPRGHAPRGHAPRGHAVPGDAPKDDGTEPKLRFSALTGIRDAAAARAAQETLRGMYDEEKLAKLYADMGVKVSFKPNAYKVADVEVGVVSAELADTRGDAKLDLKRALGATAGLLTDMMNSHVAIGDELGVMVYGTDAKPVMEAWLGGKMSGGLDKSRGVARAMKHAAEGMFMLAYGSPSEVMRSLNPQIPTLGGAAKDGGIALSVGATKGVLHLVLDLPSSQASALAAGLMTLR